VEFTGVVDISLNRGTVTPDVSAPFEAGVRVETIVVPTPGEGRVLRVEDADGNIGLSNPFTIAP
jgi:hypothetical protein